MQRVARSSAAIATDVSAAVDLFVVTGTTQVALVLATMPYTVLGVGLAVTSMGLRAHAEAWLVMALLSVLAAFVGGVVGLSEAMHLRKMPREQRRRGVTLSFLAVALSALPIGALVWLIGIAGGWC